LFDRLIASSLVSNDPVLDVRDFAWTQMLRENWQAIRDEAIAAAFDRRTLRRRSPHLPRSPRDRADATNGAAFFLWGYGYLESARISIAAR
jgi:hypothetical protein